MNQSKNKKVEFCKFLDSLNKNGGIRLKPIGWVRKWICIFRLKNPRLIPSTGATLLLKGFIFTP